MRSIIAVTGARSEYSYLYPVLKAIMEHPALRLGVIATGSHLSRAHGYTVKNIEKDGFEVVCKVKNLCFGDKDADRVKGLAVQLLKLSRFLERKKPDILLVVGDREEAMNVALIGQYMNIAVAHIGGGDRVMYNVDDQVRHAVSKLAHIHLVSNGESAQRIRKMGEQSFRIFNVGSSSLDRLQEAPYMSKKELIKYYRFPKKRIDQPLLLVIQHPLSTAIEHSYAQMRETMEAVKTFKVNTVISYPNSDPGSRAIIKCIEEYRHLPFIRIFKNIPRLQFVNTLRHAACLVGNSSGAILEGPFMKLAAVNVGDRQQKRLHAENVQFVLHDRKEIKRAIERSVFDKEHISMVKKCSNPYGDGCSGIKIAKILADISIDEKLLIKDIAY